MPDITQDPKPLDADEADLVVSLEQAFDGGVIVSHLTQTRRDELRKIARNTINPPRQAVSVRFPADDLRKLKAKAMAQGVPYQTMLTSLVHRFVEGHLVEKTNDQ